MQSGQAAVLAAAGRGRRELWLGAAACLVFSALYYWNAWAVDDAYITYRTIDNAIHGYGLRWNPSERVQTYTHPLWMLLNLALMFVTREYFFSGVALSFGLCALTLGYLWRRLALRGAGWKLGVWVAAVLSSKAVFDYTSSGLENPLSYLLAALFFVPWLERDPQAELAPGELERYALLAALAFINRQDTILIYLPVLGALAWRALRRQRLRPLLGLSIATSPAWLWLAFSLFYYGFAFPNTYYAKSANAGVPTLARLDLGVHYILHSCIADVPSLVYLLAACALVGYRRQQRLLLPLAGALAYVAYVLVTAATATHMAHRFLSVPVFVAIALLVFELSRPRLALGWVAAVALGLLGLRNSPLYIGTRWYRAHQAPNVADIKWFAHNEGASLRANLPPGEIVPRHDWYADGLRFRAAPERVRWGGPGSAGSWAMGYFGVGAGPEKQIVDPLGLCDPLLARLPAKPQEHWMAGHFERPLPQGYLETLEHGKNVLRDKSIKQYYRVLREVIRGPLFSPTRLRLMLELNLGKYDELLRAPAQRALE